jgi:hypothetical protein
MNFAATVSFTVKNGKSEDYKKLYAELKKVGLDHELDGGQRKVTLPETTVYGSYTGVSAQAIRDHVGEEVKKVYISVKLSGEFFVAVGGESTTWLHSGV